MRKISLLLVVTAALVTVPLANAAEMGGIAIGVKKGTLGNGVEVSYPINPKLTVSLGLNKYSSSSSDTTDGIDYDVDLNLQTVALLANYHPMSGAFRLTLGIMQNNNELKMQADSVSGTYSIGDNDIDYTLDSLEAKVDFKKIAPYAGLGWGFSSSSGFGFNLDLGVLMQGRPNVSFTASGTGTSVPGFQDALDEEEANAEDELKGFTMWPVIAAGVNYRF